MILLLLEERGGTLRARKNLGYSFYLNPDTQEFIPVMDYDQELALTANDEAVVYKNDSNLKDQGYTVIIRPPRVRGQLGAWTWDINKAKQHIEDLYLKPNRKGSYSVCFKHYVPSNEVFEEDGRLFFESIDKGPVPSIIRYNTSEGTKELKRILDTGNFDNPKNVDMISYLIDLIKNKNAVVLDSFAGSGTTAEAVLNLNKRDGGERRFILIEMEDYAESVTAERVKKVIKGYTTHYRKVVQLYAKRLNLSNLRKGSQILDNAHEVMENNQSRFDKVQCKLNDNSIVVQGIKQKGQQVAGVGGGFSYYTIGDTLLDEYGNFNVDVPTSTVASYIWYSETRNSASVINKHFDESGYLGRVSDTAYYLLYDPTRITVLNESFLTHIKYHADMYVIYADRLTISKDRLSALHITFKKIPRDVERF